MIGPMADVVAVAGFAAAGLAVISRNVWLLAERLTRIEGRIDRVMDALGLRRDE